jgi:hypothetical protein
MTDGKEQSLNSSDKVIRNSSLSMNVMEWQQINSRIKWKSIKWQWIEKSADAHQ